MLITWYLKKHLPTSEHLHYKAVTSLEKRHRVFASKESIQIWVTVF